MLMSKVLAFQKHGCSLRSQAGDESFKLQLSVTMAKGYTLNTS